MTKRGDVIAVNGTNVTVEDVIGEDVRIVWFEGTTLHRGSISMAMADKGQS